MRVTTKKGLQGEVQFDSGKQTAVLMDENKGQFLIAYMRDNKVKIKSDLYLNDVDLAAVKQEMSRFIKKETTSSKKKRR